MNKLVCEICGSMELVKQGDFFVCRHCGCKYTPDDVKRMMIEGTVDVQGTVKIDNSSFIQKQLANARRALDKTDWEEAEKYYNLVEQNDPQNIEAIFYSSYGKAMLSLVDSDRFKREQKFDVFKKSISVIDDYFDVSKSAELIPLVEKMSDDFIKMVSSSFVSKQGDNVLYTYNMFAKAEMQFVESLENIYAKLDSDNILDLIMKHYARCIRNPYINRQKSKDYVNKMKTYTLQKERYYGQPIPKIKVDGECYVATCVYGSYDCPQVWTLRRYRDNMLAKTWYGRAFIRTYYAISPTIVKWFGDTTWFKKMWKGRLDKIVYTLNKNGVEDTPYED